MQMLTAVSPDEAALPLRERKKRKTRRLIINTAIELFAARGFDEVTLEDIAAVCDVSRGTVFNYFPYKELMILEFMDVYMSDRLAAIRAGLESGTEPTKLLWQALDVPKDAGVQWPTFLCITARELLHHEQDRADMAQRCLSYLPLVAELIAAGQAAGSIRTGNNPEGLALYLTEASLVSIARNCTRLTGPDLDELISNRQQVLMQGILAR
ncbi:MAG: TetR/AcrR family transcriptional regulator [Chloroflexota bacterium]|nr:TetR/AcrR family transcriptional regulator [Chloroflexota bacterium]